MNFNPRSHEGSDGLFIVMLMMGTNFNPRSHEGSDGIRSVRLHLTRYFNPRSHEGSDNENLCRYGCTNISIHAPTRGATGGGSAHYCAQ